MWFARFRRSWRRARQITKRPVNLTEHNEARSARWLAVFLPILIFVLIFITILLPLSPLSTELKTTLLPINALTLATSALSYYLMRKGKINLAASLLLGGLFLAITYVNTFVFGSIRSPDISAYFVLIPLAGLLLGRQYLQLTVILSAISLIIIYIAESMGFIEPAVLPQTSINDLVLLLLGIGLSTSLLISTIRDSEISAVEARKSAANAAIINKELQINQILLKNANDEMEERVVQRTAELRLANVQLTAEIEERQRNERRFRGLAERSPDFIFIIDRLAKKWVYWNRDVLLGHTAEELSKPGAIFKYLERGAAIRWESALNSSADRRTEYRMRNAAGTWEWVQVRVTALLQNDTSSRSQFLVTLTVITEQKEYEEELRKAKENAEAATKAKNDFLANISHEIRTPMNGVIGMTSLLLSKGLSSEQREIVDTISTSSNALLTILNSILDFSKIESGTYHLEMHPYSLRNCVEDTVDLMASAAAEKGLELVCWIEPDVPDMLIGDAARLRQVLVNLISNAVKFTDNGEIFISTRLEAIEDRKCSIHFSIADTGIGIKEEHLQDIFQAFNQVDTSKTRSYEGTGLGLAISRRLSKFLGGKIWVESTIGQGSTFHFTITSEIDTNAMGEIKFPSTRAALLDGRRLLIFEENAISRNTLVMLSRTWGMHPIEAVTAEEGLRLLENDDTIEVAIIDETLPDMDAFALAERGQELQPTLQSIVLVSVTSAYEYRDDKTQQITILNKPVRALSLQMVLAKALGIKTQAITNHDANEAYDLNPTQGQNLRILLTEDNLVNQKVALRLLQRLGYDADLATNGIEAIQACEQTQYDLILMDIQMPVLDGLEATRIIRSKSCNEKQPYIIALTAAAGKLDRELCYEAGMNDFVPKPLSLEHMATAIQRLEQTIIAKLDQSNVKPTL